MPLPTIANCYQVKLVWTNAAMQRQATCAFHVSDVTGAGHEAAIMAVLNTEIDATLWTVLSGGAVITRVDITYLGTPSATVSFIPVTPAHWTGGGGTDAIPQGCAVVTLQTATRGKSHRGRIFLPWVGEVEQLQGVLLAADVATMQTAWSDLVDDMAAASFPLSVASKLLSSQSLVVSAVVRPFLKTQRRRSRR
jgi:hypothetical protein